MRWIALVGCLLTCEAALAAPATGPLHVLMNKSALNGGLVRVGKADFFDKDTLFDLVNGEAEAYFPYGFHSAVSAIYARNQEKSTEVRVEVYQMGSLLDAYGIYSTMRDSDSKPVDVGTEGFGGATQITFYAGRYFVKVHAYSAAAADALTTVAKAVAAKLPADKKKPARLALWQFPTSCHEATNTWRKACWGMHAGRGEWL